MPLAQDEIAGRVRANLERSREDAYAVTQALRKHPGADALSDERLDEICRPERYLSRLAPVFERLAALT